MSRFNNLNDKSSTAWETVRRNKTVPKDMSNVSNTISTSINISAAAGGGGSEQSPSQPIAGGSNTTRKVPEDVNENYVPKAVRNEIDEILYSSESTHTKIENLRKRIYDFTKFKKSRDIDWTARLNVYVLHKACKMNKQEIISSILDKCGDLQKYVNAISSTMSGNTCLFDAIYYGSDQCINVLLNRGADVRHVNKAGENVYNLLETGRQDSIKRHPGKDVFINARYDECLRFIKMTDDERTVRENAEKAGESKDDTTDKDKVVTEENDETKQDDKFKSSYDEESLKEAFTKHIEIIQDFKDFIKHIKETLNLDDMLKTILEDEDIQDLFEDNPYAKNLV
jgi:hypothetical protein